MTIKQVKSQESEYESVKLHRKEKELIHYIRTKFKFGDIIIQTRDGLPYRILKATEYQALG